MYIPKTITAREDYQACIQFHGHTCMGVTIGYLAAKLGLDLLKSTASVDEELIAIVETDACCCDAIQVLTGCTFGKGNFFYRDYGKMAFTFGKRETGQAYRLILKSEPFVIPDKESILGEKIRDGQGSKEEIKEYERLYEMRGVEQFAKGPGNFFSVEQVDSSLPARARMAPSKPCGTCDEMVMETKLEEVDDKLVCRECKQ